MTVELLRNYIGKSRFGKGPLRKDLPGAEIEAGCKVAVLLFRKTSFKYLLLPEVFKYIGESLTSAWLYVPSAEDSAALGKTLKVEADRR